MMGGDWRNEWRATTMFDKSEREWRVLIIANSNPDYDNSGVQPLFTLHYYGAAPSIHRMTTIQDTLQSIWITTVPRIPFNERDCFHWSYKWQNLFISRCCSDSMLVKLFNETIHERYCTIIISNITCISSMSVMRILV